jgi:hypothetical protein
MQIGKDVHLAAQSGQPPDRGIWICGRKLPVRHLYHQSAFAIQRPSSALGKRLQNQPFPDVESVKVTKTQLC